MSTLRKCAARAFGECVLDGQPPSIGNHEATTVWFDLAFACRVVVANEVTGIDFNIEGRRVCKGAFQAAYSIPATTMDNIVRRVFAGEHAWVTYAMTATAKPRSDKPSLIRIATTWWLKTLRCYDIMPHLRGVIIHPVCVWKEIYMNDFLSHAQEKGYMWSADPDKAGSNASWRAGKHEALRLYAEETYGSEYRKPFRLIAPSYHSAFKECAECKRLRLAVASAISEGKDHSQIRRKKVLQKEHLDWFMAQRNELETLRQAGARDDTIFEQARARTPMMITQQFFAHCYLFMVCWCARALHARACVQRCTRMLCWRARALRACSVARFRARHILLRLCWGARALRATRGRSVIYRLLREPLYFVLCSSDKCGDDSFYTPGGRGRLSGANQSKYTHRISLQALHIFGKAWELSFSLPMLITGADFGCTSLLTSLVRMIMNGTLTNSKRRLVRGTDVRAPQTKQSSTLSLYKYKAC
eukprot:2079113-Pleurochrysis_carterae.AAC.2